jgi:hypothetical protein
VTAQQHAQVTSCCNPLTPVRPLSSDIRLQGCLCHKRHECSLSNTTGIVVIRNRARMSLWTHFPISLCQTNRQCVCRLVNSFRDTGSVQDSNLCGRPLVISDDSSNDIRQTIFLCPGKSLRKPLHNGLFHESVRQIERDRNGLHDS